MAALEYIYNLAKLAEDDGYEAKKEQLFFEHPVIDVCCFEIERLLNFNSPTEQVQKFRLLEFLNCFLCKGTSVSLIEDPEIENDLEVTLKPEQIMNESRAQYIKANAHSLIE